MRGLPAGICQRSMQELTALTKAQADHLGIEAGKLWEAGTFEDESLWDGVVDYTDTHEETKGAFLIFLNDADQIYPGWKETAWLHRRVISQAATFDLNMSVDALWYSTDPEVELAYSTMLVWPPHHRWPCNDVFNRGTYHGTQPAMRCSILTLPIEKQPRHGDVEYGKIHGIYSPPAYLLGSQGHLAA